MISPTYDFFLGDAADVLKQLPSASVQCVLTSPPYLRARDYHAPGQLGREKSLDAYINRLVDILDESGRVLRDDGVLWVNIDDKYEDKQLLGIPWLIAFAMKARGWYWRADNVWHKNASPESAKDRPARTHEPVLLFSKSEYYYYDIEAFREPNESALSEKRQGMVDAGIVPILPSGMVRFPKGGTDKGRTREVRGGTVAYNLRGRQLRSVWRINSSPFYAKSVGITDVEHFAAMPPALAERCIRLGTPEGGVCSECLTPFCRIVGGHIEGSTYTPADIWEPGCSCDAPAIPATVLDPFAGSGTTSAKAAELNRSCQSIDINPYYLRLGEARNAYAIAGKAISS